MSAKYERIKKADEALPAPLRWLTRAFSSIRLAIVLLSFIALFGTLASVPLAYLSKFVLLLGAAGLCLGPAAWVGYSLSKARKPITGSAVTLLGLAAAGSACAWIITWKYHTDFFMLNQARVIYRLPMFEMTELEFYSWWPMRLLLAMFVVNMVWATIRRIEFRFENLGVLTVHTGIVLIALGSIFYGYAKVEGDALLVRKDIGGVPVRKFYDATEPAIYLRRGGHRLMLPLPELPRYNDYHPGTLGQNDGQLAIELHENKSFQTVFGDRLRVSIPGFVAYGTLIETWRDASDAPRTANMPAPEANPGIRLMSGTRDRPVEGGLDEWLVASVPAERVFQTPAMSIEYLTLNQIDAQRLDDLRAEFRGNHGLIVELPEFGFRGVYAIEPGQVIQPHGTGFKLTVEDIGAYGLAFASPGYEGATDTRAQVLVEKGDRRFRRIAMHRYPERSQDFLLPAPGEEPEPGAGPMGQRVDPAQDVKLTYLDATKPQFRLVDVTPSAMDQPDGDNSQKTFLLIGRLPGGEVVAARLDPADLKFPVGRTNQGNAWVHLVERAASMEKVLQPQPTPLKQRDPSDEGTYIHSLMPVDLQKLDEAGERVVWQKRLWMAHMRYPMFPEGMNRPARVEVPGIGAVELIFSRQEHRLPFSLALAGFEMQPYPGSDIPLDYVSELRVEKLDEDRRPTGVGTVARTKLNDPMYYMGYKLSQSGWDPGDPNDPNKDRRDAQGRFTNQQRFSIIGVGNNRGIMVIALGSVLVVVGIPWAFYVKPLLIRRKRDRLRAEAQAKARAAEQASPEHADPPQPRRASVTV